MLRPSSTLSSDASRCRVSDSSELKRRVVSLHDLKKTLGVEYKRFSYSVLDRLESRPRGADGGGAPAAGASATGSDPVPRFTRQSQQPAYKQIVSTTGRAHRL